MEELNEPNELSERRKHPADALADLAENDKVEEFVSPDTPDPHAALDEMARDDGGTNADDIADPAVGTDDNEIDDPVLFGDNAPLESAGGLHVTAGEGHRRHHAHLYKKTMIPLLMTVGVLLLLIGLLAGSMTISADGETDYRSRMTLVTFTSFPLSAVMFFGAWWFRREVNRKS